MERRKSKRNVDNSSRRQTNSTIESVDRISALPDSILGVILSLLPTKNALATSALSKRWEFMWRTIHNLDFCLKDEDEDEDEDEIKKFVGFDEDEDEIKKFVGFDEDEDEIKKFVGFVNHVLLRHDAGVLNKFRLVWTRDCVQSHATSWIKTAITRNVHELSINLCDTRADFDMRICVFSCDSLRYLQLSGRICLSAPTVFCLPKLESLDLDRVTFESDETFEKMIRGCPVLNYLNIRTNAAADDDSRFVISSTSLRHLELNLGWLTYLQLEASSLEHLRLYGCYIPVNFGQKTLSSLVEANFMIYLHYNDFSVASICNSVVDEVSAFDSVKILTLSDHVMRALSCATTRLSTNLERLVILKASIDCCHWSSLQDFIRCSNNLEALTIYKDQIYLDDDNDHDHSNWTTPIEIPRCLPTSLKKFVLEGYYGHEDEREMIRYMLKHGSVLEEMKVSCRRDEISNKSELFQEICEFPRKSPACKVKFFELNFFNHKVEFL